MSRSYGFRQRVGRHHVPDGWIVVLSAALVVGVWLGPRPHTALVLGAIAVAGLLMRSQVALLGLAAGLLLVGAVLGERAWAHAHARQLGDYTGWVRVVADPVPFGRGLRLTVEVQHERFDAWLYGARRNLPAQYQVGEFVWVQGRRTPVRGNWRRAALRHVVGGFDVLVLADRDRGSAITRASNRVRTRLRHAAEATMPPAEAALFAGLVIGDDAREPPWLVLAFRRSGLSHLTAVSGQNVGYTLIAAMPLLRRLRPGPRWVATVALIAWFMALTRFEPSVLRAGMMAVLAATAHVRGQQASPLRLLALAVLLLVALDPLLVWSVGFWLSVSATAGVCQVAPWFVPRLPGPLWLRLPLAVTLGAQVGVALPSLLVFHRLPLVSIPANLAAVPVAGAVMLYGIPSGLVAPVLPGVLQHVLMLPNALGTRWVATVARLAAALEPSPGWGLAGWVALVVGVTVHRWVLHRRSRSAPPDVPS